MIYQKTKNVWYLYASYTYVGQKIIEQLNTLYLFELSFQFCEKIEISLKS